MGPHSWCSAHRVLCTQSSQAGALPLTGVLGLAAVLYGLYQLRGSGVPAPGQCS